MHHFQHAASECLNSNITTKGTIPSIIRVLSNKEEYFDHHDPCKITPTPKINWECIEPVQTTSIMYASFWIIVLLLILLLNTIVIYAISNKRYLRSSVTNSFIASLAVSDILVAVCIVPVRIGFALKNLRFCFGFVVCRFYLTADYIFFTASITNLVIISVDRYLAMLHPYYYQRLLTKSRAKVIIALVWLNAILWGSSGNVKWSDPSKDAIVVGNDVCLNQNKWYVTTVFILVFYIPVILMGFVYTKILLLSAYHAGKIAKDIPCNRLVVENSDSELKMKKKKRFSLKKSKKKTSTSSCITQKELVLKATKTVAVVYGTFVICWLPASIFTLLETWCQTCFDNSDWQKGLYVPFIEVLPILNSLFNPVIYTAMNKQYRRAFREILRKLVPKDQPKTSVPSNTKSSPMLASSVA